MEASFVFSFFNTLVLPVWLLMLVAPNWKYTQQLVFSYTVPIAIAFAYTCIMMSNLGIMQDADFSSLEGIKKLFKGGNDWLVSAAWFHYLAFDLLVGTMIFRDSKERGIAHLWMIPCLIFTFMLGPVGFFLYQAIRFFSPKKS